MIVTHSAALLASDVLTKVSRFSVQEGHTRRTALNVGLQTRQQREKLEKQLRESMDLRAALFSRGVILVEGESEAAALPLWFQKSANDPLSQDVVMLPVDGDQQFSTLVSILHQLGIPWSILCDAKVIAGSNPPARNIVLQLTDAGIQNLPDLGSLDFGQRCEVLAESGVFTLARKGTDELENLPVMQLHKAEADREVGRSKPRRARYIASVTECPTEVGALLQQAVDHLKATGL